MDEHYTNFAKEYKVKKKWKCMHDYNRLRCKCFIGWRWENILYSKSTTLPFIPGNREHTFRVKQEKITIIFWERSAKTFNRIMSSSTWMNRGHKNSLKAVGTACLVVHNEDKKMSSNDGSYRRVKSSAKNNPPCQLLEWNNCAVTSGICHICPVIWELPLWSFYGLTRLWCIGATL